MNRAISLLSSSCVLLTCLAAPAYSQVVPARVFTMNASGDDYAYESPPIGVMAAAVQGRDGLLGMAGYAGPFYDNAQVGRVGVFHFESGKSAVRTGSIDLTDRVDNELYFGTAVALDAGTAVVTSSAAIRIYQKDNGTWQERSRTLPDSPNFVFAAGPLAFKDGVLAVPMRDNRDSEAPLRLFLYDIAKRGAARHVATIRVGQQPCSLASLILRQHTLAVGVPCDGGTGAVYIYEEGKDASQWKLADRLVPTVPKTASGFGNAVDLRHGTLVVGAPAEPQDFQPGPDSGDFTSGVGYIFKRSGGHWAQTLRVDPSLSRILPRSGFGWSVAITDTRVAFGAPQSTTGRYEDYANVDVFTWQGEQLAYDQSFQGNLGYGDYMLSTKRWLLIGQPGDPYGSEFASAISFDPNFP